MEKRTPHCKLAAVESMAAAGKARSTISALDGGAALGFGFEAILGVVAALTPKDFYKSMTTYAECSLERRLLCSWWYPTMQIP